MKRILVQAGKHPYTVPTAESTLLKNSIRGNTGNLMYTNAAYKHLLTPNARLAVDETQFRHIPVKDAERINAECDVLVIPMANAFKKKFVPHLNGLTKLIKHLKVPVVVFGIGAQSHMDSDTASLASLNKAVRGFIGAVLDRSASVGVRGEFTQRYLNELGFKNVDIIGCPSVYMNGRGFRIHKRHASLPDNAKIALSTALKIHEEKLAASIDAAALRRYPGLTYFAQQTGDLEGLYWGDDSRVMGRKRAMPFLMSHPLMRADACMPLEPHGWMRALAEYDFAVGTRIHGNIAAMMAGIPAFVNAHDSRTLELAQYHHFPHRLITDLKPDVDIAELYAAADFSEFNQGYDAGFQRMLDFLTKNGLENTHEHGDGGAEYDRTMAEAGFPPPFRRPPALTPDEIAMRFMLLHRSADETAQLQENIVQKQELAALESRVKAMQTSIDELRKAHEKQVKALKAAAQTPGSPSRSGLFGTGLLGRLLGRGMPAVPTAEKPSGREPSSDRKL